MVPELFVNDFHEFLCFLILVQVLVIACLLTCLLAYLLTCFIA